MDKRIIAGFNSQNNAEAARRELMSQQLSLEDISIISNGQSSKKYIIVDPAGNNLITGNYSEDGLEGIAEADLLDNNNQYVRAAGPLREILALNPEDGVKGALLNYGVGPAQSNYFAQSIQNGKTILVTRAPKEQVDAMTSILNKHEAYEIFSNTEYNDGVG